MSAIPCRPCFLQPLPDVRVPGGAMDARRWLCGALMAAISMQPPQHWYAPRDSGG